MAWVDMVTRALSYLVSPTDWNTAVGNLDHLREGVVGKAAGFTIDPTEAVIYIVDTSGGARQATIPAATIVTQVTVKREGASNVTFTGANVDGGALATLSVDYDWVTIASDGSAWYMIGHS